MSVTIALLLGLMVAMTWLSVLGFARLRAPLDRLHCVAFFNVAALLPFVAAAVMADGVSVRVGKITLMMAINLFGGAAMSHAIGRALHVRGKLAP